MRREALVCLLFNWCLMVQVQCTHDDHNFNKSQTDSSEYSEKNDFIDNYNPPLQEDYSIENNLENNIEEEIDYEVEPPHHFRPVVPYDQNYGEPPLRPYMRKYQPYFQPSEQMQSFAPKPMASPMASPILENQIKQQPVYANLYWRKIVYPYPSYSGQNPNENIVLSDNSSPELQTGESNLVKRRYAGHKPYRGYYRKRRRYPVIKTMKPQNTAFYSIPIQTSRMRPIVRYYKNPYQRRRKVRPIKRNYKQNQYFYVNNS